MHRSLCGSTGKPRTQSCPYTCFRNAALVETQAAIALLDMNLELGEPDEQPIEEVHEQDEDEEQPDEEPRSMSRMRMRRIEDDEQDPDEEAARAASQ